MASWGNQRCGCAIAAAAALWTLAVSGCGGGAGSGGFPPPPPVHLEHIIVVVQENRSFDELFHGFPGADTVSTGQTSTGKTVQLQPIGLVASFDAGHAHGDFLNEYDNGKMNGFDRASFSPKTAKPPPYFAYSYVPRSDAQPYWDMATQYTVADRMFQSNSGPSYPAHQYLIAGQSALAFENPTVPKGSPVGTGWGCDDPPGTFVPTMAAHYPFPCFDYQTLGDEMDRQGVSWAYYAPAEHDLAGGYIWSAYNAVRHIRFGSDWTKNVISPQTTIISDILGGRLPQVSWVVPDGRNSDHSLFTDGSGPSWVASIVNVLGQSPYWNTSAVVILWDDWGGWYDHVAPQQIDTMGLGFRVPLIVVSPYAKHGYVSHVQHEFGSILKFTEETFQLPSLGLRDVRSDDLSDCFDFTRTPSPFKRIAAPAYHTTAKGRVTPPDDE